MHHDTRGCRIFTPNQLMEEHVTGRDIQIPLGDPVQFTIIVGSDGTVTVTSP